MSYGYDENCFGFTKQTAMVLKGLGIGDSIPQFKNRNIPTHALSQLSRNDFITLGVAEEMVNDIIKRLSSRIDRDKSKLLNIEDKSRQFIDIFKSGKQQLSLIQAFITYTYMKMLQTPSDYIIDANTDMRASEALCIVANCAIQEINDLEKKLKEISAYVCEDDRKKGRLNRRILTWVSGIGLSGCLIYTLYYVVGPLRRT